MTAQVQSALGVVVADTDPYVRSGYVQLLSDIYCTAGRILAGPALKTIVEVLSTLSADPHPLVHYWSLRALSAVADAAGPDFTPYVAATLSLLQRIAGLDSHDPDSGSPAMAVHRGRLPIQRAMCALLGSVISGAGPSLSEVSGGIEITFAMVRSFLLESDTRTVMSAETALERLFLIAGPTSAHHEFVYVLVPHLFSSSLGVQVAAVDTLYQVVRHDVTLASKLGGEKLVERLFTILDMDPNTHGVKHTILAWLEQSANTKPQAWISICQKVLSQESGGWQVSERAIPGFVEDEEAQGLGTLAEDSKLDGLNTELARWTTRCFALECMCRLIEHLSETGDRHHFVQPARSLPPPKQSLHVYIPDLIRMAFAASTSQTVEIRLRGLDLLRNVIQVRHPCTLAASGQTMINILDRPLLGQ